MPSHTMELPRQIVVGEKNINDIGNFLNSLKKTKKISLVSGSNVKKIVQRKIEASLIASKIKSSWYLAKTNDQKTIQDIEKKVRQDKSEFRKFPISLIFFSPTTIWRGNSIVCEGIHFFPFKCLLFPSQKLFKG